MAAKLKLYISMTLDGFIAGKGGSIDFLDNYLDIPEVHNHYKKFYDGVSDIMFGKTTYLKVKNELSDSWPYEDKNSYVFTHEDLQDENVTFVNEKLVETVNELKETAQKDIWVLGGAKLVNQLLDEALIDEMIITIVPKMLGTGTKLFKKKSKNDWKLTKTRKVKDLLYVTYVK